MELRTTSSSTTLGRPFVIIATQRTGSTLLVRSLDASPTIFCAGELFHEGRHVLHAEYGFPQELFGSRLLAYLADSIFSRTRIKNHLKYYFTTAGVDVRAVGFKVMVSQLRDYRALLPLLVELGAARLFLYRQDILATALSYLRAKLSGVYHSDRVDRTGDALTVTADVDEFRTLLERCESHKSALLALHSTHGGTLLRYEDMETDWNAFVRSVGNEIGIQDLRLPTALEKLGRDIPAARIDNEDTLRKQFSAWTSL